MTKKERHSIVNKKFFEMYENEFTISDDGEGGRITLEALNEGMLEGGRPSDNYITYHLSRHDVICLNWASDEIKGKVQEMELYLWALLDEYELN